MVGQTIKIGRAEMERKRGRGRRLTKRREKGRIKESERRRRKGKRKTERQETMEIKHAKIDTNFITNLL